MFAHDGLFSSLLFTVFVYMFFTLFFHNFFRSSNDDLRILMGLLRGDA